MKHYNVAVIGGSLSARITATLLAKNGLRVLFIRRREAAAPAWFHSSLFLEQLLGNLGGRACFVAPKPTQILSRHARLSLHADNDLTDDLKREFGPHGSSVIQFLDELVASGNLIENLLWEHGGLPWPGLKSSARFRFLCLRHKLKLSELDVPVAPLLEKFPGNVRRFLTDLFQGLTLLPVAQISLAKAALVWTHACRPENLQEPDFSQLLNKRYQQFHGAKEDLDEMAEFTNDAGLWTGGSLKNGTRFEADIFLLGDVQRAKTIKQARIDDLPDSQPIKKYLLGDLAGQLSPLLSSRVICGGNIPMRIALDPGEEGMMGQMITHNHHEEDVLRRQLEPVLPFAKHTMQTTDEDEEQDLPATNIMTKLTDLPLQLGKNLYCADSTALLPGMGAAGAALVGWTLAEHLVTQK